MPEPRGRSDLLRGLRVLELGQYVAAPFVGQLLADLGADVLKVERPGGDPYRAEAGRFVAWNRGKRSVVIDLGTANDRERLLKLARSADVLVENFRPGTLRRLGIDLAALAADNPGLVTCSITGFGNSGPLRDERAWEPLVHARAGINVGFGEPSERVWRPFPLASVAAGAVAALAIVAALFDREQSGLGQHVETSLLDAALYINGSSILQGDAPPMEPQSRVAAARVHIYPTSDGYVQVVAGTDKSLHAFEQLLHDAAAPDPGTGPFFDEAGEELTLEVAKARAVMLTRTTVEWERELAELGIPAGSCNSPRGLARSPHRGRQPALGAVAGVTFRGPHLRGAAAAGLPASPPRPRIATTTSRSALLPPSGSARPEWEHRPRFLSSLPAGTVSDERNGPLDGVTVLDLTRILPGPLTGRLLAELGADVLKIEPPGGEQGYSVAFMYLEGNRSKRSQAIDLALEDGRRAFLDAASKADVVVENARAGVWDRLGIGEAQLRQENPALIYARAKGFGLEGPHAWLRAFEHVLQAMTGMQMTQGGSGPPRMMTVPACDYAAPVYLAIGIVCGLLARLRGAAGQTVTSSLAAAASVYEAEHLTRIEPSRRVIDSVGANLRGPDATRRIYRVVGGWILVLAVSPEQQDALGRALGVGELDQTAVADALAPLSSDDALAMLEAAGVPAAPSVHPQEVASDPQVIVLGAARRARASAFWPGGAGRHAAHDESIR